MQVSWIFTVLTPLLHSVLMADARSDTRRIRHMRRLRDVHERNETKSQYNHKPIFMNCSQYQPTVKEEEPHGTYVFTATAYDRDKYDSILYSLVQPGERLKFSINETTGQIKTAHMFDRDEPAREKEIYVTVRATDNGKPPLDGVCTVKVTIEDVNDNIPSFDKVSYEESIPLDTQMDKEVMRISATDVDDGINSIVKYDLQENPSQWSVNSDVTYFKIQKETGIIYLKRPIDKDVGYRFKLRATASDSAVEPRSAQMDLTIVVIDSDKKPPTFKTTPSNPIQMKEGYDDYTKNIATFSAVSNTDEKNPIFELVNGKTEQTNKQNTFRLETEGDLAHIRLSSPLDYEKVTDYQLTVRIKNKYNLASETVLLIKVEDENDNIPYFIGVESGSVFENEPIGTQVMQVRAVDQDITPLFKSITYELVQDERCFQIDPYTGNITTMQMFDREARDSYQFKVIAMDGAPSAIIPAPHNKGTRDFSIKITDQNDHAPHFTHSVYVAEAIPENANVNSLVTEVKALDNDTATSVIYSIEVGNENNVFLIEGLTGKIRVNGVLDYESVTNYSLKVRAFDGAYDDFCKVDVRIENVNDNAPVFQSYLQNFTIMEEELREGCLVQVSAYDPDIPDRRAEQHIVFKILKEEQKKFLSIDKTGCLSLIEPLDRDPPNGHEIWQVIIQATDNDGNSDKQTHSEVHITLKDKNDNAPYLSLPGPVIWQENKLPGVITQLQAQDNDGPENGPPFSFEINMAKASNDILEKFSIIGNNLMANVMFDRERQKQYVIPIDITDNGIPAMKGLTYLTVTIGDENDNEMMPGESSIFMYSYKGETKEYQIGRIYVEDKDDWDLGDKNFEWRERSYERRFSINENTGMITIEENTPPGTYHLYFMVKESSKHFREHSVEAFVNVTVKAIPEEAVDKSGSIRFMDCTPEEFITTDEHGNSKASLLKSHISHILNTSEENVDVFTIRTKSSNVLDVRFSAHGSPYKSPEHLNSLVTKFKEELERELDKRIGMINIDECLVESPRDYCNDSACINLLIKKDVPAVIFTNKTSFAGVDANVEPFCKCSAKPNICLNGGTYYKDGCVCPVGFQGPNCESTSIGFTGQGWALYPSLQACEESNLYLYFTTLKENAMIFYVGPDYSLLDSNDGYASSMIIVNDFMALEVRNGYLTLLVNYGTGTAKLEHIHKKISDGKRHKVHISLSITGIELTVDNCKLHDCMALSPVPGSNKFLNVNGPLQLGGSYVNLDRVASHRNWTHRPLGYDFVGCIENFTFNAVMYNLGMPGIAKNVNNECAQIPDRSFILYLPWNFLLIVLICFCILTAMLMALVVHRKKTIRYREDKDDIIRENIMEYSDEGGGEGDQSGFDMSVLRIEQDYINEKGSMNGYGPYGVEAVPDICGFLDDKKHCVDNDPECTPFDDVRHYAYEGDGNTTGSLSSLASGTDEGDLNFDYLSNFGPRFRKLADMYGEDASDEESDTYHRSESWC